MSMIIRRHAPGSRGAAETVAGIIGFAVDPYSYGDIRRVALELTQGCENDDERARRIFGWVSRRIAYVRDPVYREHVQQPLWVLQKALSGSAQAAGDCDCHAAIVGALCSSLGIPIRIALSERADKRGPRHRPSWAHVWAEAQLPYGTEIVETPAGKMQRSKTRWVAMDTSMAALKGIPMGKTPPGRQTRVYPEDIGQEAMREASTRASSGKYEDPSLGFAAELISAGTTLTQSAINKRIAEKTAAASARATMAVVNAQAAVAEEEARLQHEAEQLDAERAARGLEHQQALVTVRDAAEAGSRRLLAAGAIALGVGLGVSWLRSRRRR